MGTLRTNDGVGLRYTDEGSGNPIVLVGGFAMAAEAWRLQRDVLSQQYRVVALDRRGHGASECPGHGHRMARHAKDLRELLDELDLDDALVVGASMGASVIWAYVDLFGTERLRGIATLDQTPKMVNEDGWEWGMYGLDRTGLDDFVRNFPGGHQPFHRLPEPDVLMLLQAGREGIQLDALRPLLRDHAEADWRDVLPHIDVPLLAITGRQSPLWPCESSIFVAEQAPLGRALVLEDCGHVPFLEQPEQVNSALAELAK